MRRGEVLRPATLVSTMSIIGHIVRKDFAFLRQRLAMWAAFVAAKFGFGLWILHGGSISHEDLAWLQGVTAMLVVSDLALTWLLAVLLVQEDGASGAAAWWRTRPIGPGRMLGAKIASGALLLLMPSLVLALPWWIACGLSPAQMALVALEATVLQGAVLALGFGAAALSASVGRCFVWTLTIGASLVVANGFVSALVTGSIGSALPPVFQLLWVQGVVLALTLAATMVVQYGSGAVRRGGRVLAAGLVAALAAPWGLALLAGGASTPNPEKPAQESSAGVAIEWTQARVFGGAEETSASKSLREHPMVAVRMGVTGLPAGYAVSGRARYRWQAADGRSGTSEMSLSSGASDSLAVAVVKDPERVAQAAVAARRELWGSIWLNEAETKSLRAGPANYEAAVRLSLVRPGLRLITPVQGSRWQARGGSGARVLAVEARGTDLKAEVLESRVFSVVREWQRVMAMRREGDRDITYVVHNPQRGTTTSSWGATRAGVLLGGVEVGVRTLDLFNPTTERNGRRQATYPDWADTTSLAVVAFDEVRGLEPIGVRATLPPR